MDENRGEQHDSTTRPSVRAGLGLGDFRLSGSSSAESEASAKESHVHEEWLKGMEHLERGGGSSRFEQLGRMGIDMPAPETLSDRKLRYKLWGIIYALAAMDAYLSHTDHLTDRELYEELWHRTLRTGTFVKPAGSGWMCHLGLLDSGSEEDIDLQLRFHMSDAERARWANEFPNDRIPPREAKKACRDQILPRSPMEHPQLASEFDNGSDIDME